MKTKKDNKTISNSRAIIDTYTSIYPVDLVVANKYVTLEELKELYVYSDDLELDEEVTNCDASTCTVKRKSDNKFCLLVKYNHPAKHITDKKLDFINTCSHEATHVALDIYEFIHQQVCNCSSEPFCYLQGWATECIYKTLSKK